MPPSWIGFLLCGIGHFASRPIFTSEHQALLCKRSDTVYLILSSFLMNLLSPVGEGILLNMIKEEPRWLCGVVTGEIEVWVPEAARTNAEWVVEAQVAAAPWAAFQSGCRRKNENKTNRSRGTTELKGLMSIIFIVLSIVALEKFQSLSCENMWENRRSIANEYNGFSSISRSWSCCFISIWSLDRATGATGKCKKSGDSTISVVLFPKNNLGGRVVSSHMSSKSGCLKQCDDPVPKG
uniref:Uncharacterized protein n=1 Tax=Oryza glumipatula TaxID=40148 RepID=A0A0D9ZIT2_9ORYZ